MTAKTTDPHGRPARQRWDERYAHFHKMTKLTPTHFVQFCLPYLPREGRALDIAAGAGRHTLALARHGLQVDALDIAWQGLRLAQQRALARGLVVGRDVNFLVVDVEQPWLPERLYEVILVSLFLYRPLWPLIRARLQPGGYLLYESLLNQPDNPAPIRAKFQLQPGELKAAFSDLQLLFYDEGEHHGRATAQLLAQNLGAGVDEP